jgi:uncharacterized OsmC-like protein
MKNPSSLIVNGIDIAALSQTIEEARAHDGPLTAEFGVRTTWRGQTRSRTRTTKFRLAGEEIERDASFDVDEPPEFCGTDEHPNPQEFLLGALNSCLVVGYAMGAALRGIRLESIEIETEGALDLRGFLGVDSDVPAGYRRLACRVRLRARTSAARLRELHESVKATSPNFFNLTRAVRIEADLEADPAD